MDSPAQQQETLQERIDGSDVNTEVADVFDELEAADEAAEEESTETIEEETPVEEVEAQAEEVPEDEADEPDLDLDSEEEQPGEAEAVEYAEAAPERWPDEMKEVYNALPPAAKEAMLEGVYKPMQRQYGQTTQELAGMRKGIEPMLDAMNQYRGDFERMGVNPAEAFRRQMAWASHLARVGPEQGMKDMSASYGIKPQGGQADEPYLTPTERLQQAQIDAQGQRLDQMMQGQQQQTQDQQQYAQQARFNEVQSGLQEFTNEQKDGKPAHPHIDRVAPAIAGLIRGGLVMQADDYGQPVPVRDQLAQAYQMACNMDPSIRSAAPRNVRQVARAKAAQNVGIVTNNPVTRESGELNTLSEGIDAIYDKLDRTG